VSQREHPNRLFSRKTGHGDLLTGFVNRWIGERLAAEEIEPARLDRLPGKKNLFCPAPLPEGCSQTEADASLQAGWWLAGRGRTPVSSVLAVPVPVSRLNPTHSRRHEMNGETQ